MEKLLPLSMRFGTPSKQISYCPSPDVLKLLENFPKGERGPAIDEAIRAMYGEESDATKARIRAAFKEILKDELNSVCESCGNRTFKPAISDSKIEVCVACGKRR